MAVNTKMPLTNTADGYLCEGTDVRGGYFTIDLIANIPATIAKNGALCYVTGTEASPVNKFYQYNGTNWVEKVFGNLNVQSDWSETDDSLDTYIKNKPNVVVEGDSRLSDARTPLTHGHTATEITEDATHRFVTDNEKIVWSGKQDAITETNKLEVAKISGLSTVATTGNYTDLSNIPGVADGNTAGLMSADDKKNLDTLTDLLKDDDANTTVDTIREVLDVFKEYPEETTIVNALAGKASATHTHTTVHKPEGTVSRPTFTGTEAGHSHSFGGSSSHNHSFTGTGTVIKGTFIGTEQTTSVNYTPEGAVSTPEITVTPNTSVVNSITDVGTLPTLDTADVEVSKVTAWSAGSVPALTYSEVKASKITAWSAGSLPNLTHSEVESSNITAWDAGTTPSLTFMPGSLPSASLSDSSASLAGTVSSTGPNRTVTLTQNYTKPILTFSAGALPTADFSAGTAPTLAYSEVKADTITSWSAGSVSNLAYDEVDTDNITEWSTGTVPSLTCEPTAVSKLTSWSPGTLPSKGADTTVVTGIKSATSSKPTFTGTVATISHTHTPSGIISITTATPGSDETANYTPNGTIDSKSVSISGTTSEAKITPEGSVSQPTFTGTEATLITSTPNS